MAVVARLLRHAFAEWGALERWFPAPAMARIRDGIARGETRHHAEICFAVESRLALGAVAAGVDAGQRARTLFAQLGVWDTARNSGVLIYALLAEHRIEVVADRAIAAAVDPQEWLRICDAIAGGFHAGDPARGVLEAIESMHELLAAALGAPANNCAELSDQPIVL